MHVIAEYEVLFKKRRYNFEFRNFRNGDKWHFEIIISVYFANNENSKIYFYYNFVDII